MILKLIKKNKKTLLIASSLILLFLIIIIIKSFNSKESEIIKEKSDQEVLQQLQKNKSVNQTQNPSQSQIKKLDSSSSYQKIVYSTSELCENHVFYQGKDVTVNNKKIIVNKIGPSSIKLSVNNKEGIINEGSSNFIDGIRIEFLEGKKIYFGPDDENNAVELRIGCKSGEDTLDKHILSNLINKGTNICEALIKSCQEEFNLK